MNISYDLISRDAKRLSNEQLIAVLRSPFMADRTPRAESIERETIDGEVVFVQPKARPGECSLAADLMWTVIILELRERLTPEQLAAVDGQPYDESLPETPRTDADWYAGPLSIGA